MLGAVSQMEKSDIGGKLDLTFFFNKCSVKSQNMAQEQGNWRKKVVYSSIG